MNLPPPPRYPPPSPPPPAPYAYVATYRRQLLLTQLVFVIPAACLWLPSLSEPAQSWPTTVVLGSGTAFVCCQALWALYVLLSRVPWLVVDAAGIHVKPGLPRGGRSRPWAQVYSIRIWTEHGERQSGSTYAVTCLEITGLPPAGSTPPRLTVKSSSVMVDVAALHRAVTHFAPHVQVWT